MMRRDRPASSSSSKAHLAAASLPVALAIVTAIAGGLASAGYALRARSGFERLTVGDWTSETAPGSDEGDPYARARARLRGLLPLGAAEGFAFTARRDSEGSALSLRCRYRIDGALPPARLWTLSAFDMDEAASPSPVATLTSHQALYRGDGSLAIEIGPRASPGNWMKTAGDGAMRLDLTLYDTPSVSRSGISPPVLPSIGKTGCDA